MLKPLGADAAKTDSKKLVQQSAEATGDLTGNEIADRISSVGKTKIKEKEDETNKRRNIYIPTEKTQQYIDDFDTY